MLNLHRFIFTVWLICLATLLKAQLGGSSTFAFLLNQPGARIASLGGYAIATKDSDINLIIQNPSLLDSSFKNQLTYNHVSMFADISGGYVAYAFRPIRKWSAVAGVQYVNYGDFTKTSTDGQVLGTFSAGEYCYHVSTSFKQSENLTYGGSLKFIYSSLESYASTGIAADIAATYYIPSKRITFTAVASNIGSQITTYNGTYEPIPLNLQLGFSKKFEHNPLRISVIAHNLQNLGKNIYQIQARNNRNINLETGLPTDENLTIYKEILSHLVVNTELVITRSFMLRVGYNYLRRREMALTDNLGVSGFSWGFGMRVSKFAISYGSASYMVGRATNHFSITVNPRDLFKKSNQL